MRVRGRLYGVVGLLALAGCWPSITFGPDAQLTCVSDDDCPAELVCATAVGRCAPVGATFDTTAPQVLRVNATPALASTTVPAVVTMVATEPLQAPPVLQRLRTRDGATEAIELAVTENDDGSYAATIAPDVDDVSGAVELHARLVDLAGNTSTSRLEVALAFDVDGPAVLDADVLIGADPVTNVLFPAAPTAARADSTVVVEVLLTEPVSAAQASLFDAVADTSLVDELSLTIIADDPRRLNITLPPALLSTLDDGDYLVELELTDAVGNSAQTRIETPVEVDHTPPTPPELESLTRAPWGSIEFSDATTAVGVVDDAVLVLGVLSGTTVEPGALQAPPATVNRVAPVDGRFSLTFPTDIPDVGAVAVDRAGNLSAVALATTTAVHATVLASSSPHRVASRQVFLQRLIQRGDVDHTRALREGAAEVSAATWWERLTTSNLATFSQTPLLALEPREHVILVVSNGETFKLIGHDLVATGAPPLPTVREGAMVTDEDRGVVVYFGGTRLDGTTTNDVFEWNGTAWQARLVDVPAGQKPAPRAGHSMVWVPGQGLLIVNGCAQVVQIGLAGCERTLTPETWRYDGSTMQLLCRGADCGVTPFPFRPALVVDNAQRVLSFGGAFLSGLFVQEGTPTVSVFDLASGTWDGECTGAGCNKALVNAGAFRDDDGVVQVLGNCSGTPCLRSYVDEQFTDRAVAAADFTFRFDSFQQASWLAVPTAGVFIGAITNGGSAGAILKLDDTAMRPFAPLSVTPRCGGAAVTLDNDVDNDIDSDGRADVLLSAGCSACNIGLETSTQSCTRLTSSERIVDDVVRPEADGPGGIAFAAQPGVPLLLQSALDPQTGRAALLSHHHDGTGWIAHPLAPLPVDDALVGRVLGAYVDPTSPTRAIALLGASLAGEHPQTLDVLLAVDGAGGVSTACTADCGTTSIGGGQPAVGAGASFGVAFGGSNSGRPTNTTAVARGPSFISETTPDSPDGPDGRRGSALATDTERDVAWLVGGLVSAGFATGNDIFRCNGENDETCADIHAFDGTSWREFVPVDVLGSGQPRSRLLAQTAWNGALTIVGGTVRGETLADAWRLHTSSATSPATLLTIELQAFGPGTSQTPDAVEVVWCGVARDGADEAVDVVLSVWTGTRFTRLVTRDAPEFAAGSDTSCVRGTSVNSDIASLSAAVQGNQLVVAAHIDAAPRAGLGMPSLRTEVLEPIVIYRR